MQYKVQCQRTLYFNYRWRSVFMKSPKSISLSLTFFCNDIPDPYSGLKIAIISKVHRFDKTNQPSILFPNIQIDNSKLRLKFKITWRNITAIPRSIRHSNCTNLKYTNEFFVTKNSICANVTRSVRVLGYFLGEIFKFSNKW